MSDEVKVTGIIALVIMVVVLSIVTVFYFGYVHSAQVKTDRVKACVDAGNQWVYDSCIGLQDGR